MMSNFDAHQDYFHREIEGRIIAELAYSTDGLISTGMRIYIESPWMEQYIAEYEVQDESDILNCVTQIIEMWEEN